MTIDLIGDVRITASDRADTVVVVNPRDRTKEADVKAAEQVVVECEGDKLLVRATKSWRQYTPFGGNGTVDVTIELPTGSQVASDLALGHLSADGELGDCQLKTAMGNIRLDQTGALRASTGFGGVTVDHAMGDAQITTGSGRITVATVDGAAVVKNSNGDTMIGEVLGDLRVKAANGDVTIGRAHASATAKTANGDISIAEVRRGEIVIETAAGELAVGVREGTAAWLDVVTRFGSVRNGLDAPEGAAPSGPTVEVRARTSVGDIVISRARADEEPRPRGRSKA